jgi:predicted transposase/invertase (TIGR01784 family)
MEESNIDVLTANRMYKSRIFAMLFSDRNELLKLYNAINGTSYDDPDLLQVNTLENAVYMSMQNDVSFIIDMRLNLYEHQSTYSPNLPVRYLLYVADVYSDYTKDMNLYGTKAVKLPTPRFVIFYNGQAEQPDRKELKLSELFSIPDADPSLELKAVMLNINKGHNRKLMETCRTLQDYAEYTFRVREYAAEMPLDLAVEQAITECISEGILADFLRKNRAEAKKVSIYEYDEERHMRQTREEGMEEGYANGFSQGIEQGITQTVINLLKSGFLTDIQIREITGLDQEQLDELKKR